MNKVIVTRHGSPVYGSGSTERRRTMNTPELHSVRSSQIEVLPLSATQMGRWAGITWSDAPYALVIHRMDGRLDPDAQAVWGLDRNMSVDEAWEDFDYADEYEVVE